MACQVCKLSACSPLCWWAQFFSALLDGLATSLLQDAARRKSTTQPSPTQKSATEFLRQRAQTLRLSPDGLRSRPYVMLGRLHAVKD